MNCSNSRFIGQTSWWSGSEVLLKPLRLLRIDGIRPTWSHWMNHRRRHLQRFHVLCYQEKTDRKDAKVEGNHETELKKIVGSRTMITAVENVSFQSDEDSYQFS